MLDSFQGFICFFDRMRQRKNLKGFLFNQFLETSVPNQTEGKSVEFFFNYCSIGSSLQFPITQLDLCYH